MAQYDNVLPIWGIQKESELDEWLSYMHDPAEMTLERQAFIEREKKELVGDFWPRVGYCMPCPGGDSDQQLRAHVADAAPRALGK